MVVIRPWSRMSSQQNGLQFRMSRTECAPLWNDFNGAFPLRVGEPTKPPLAVPRERFAKSRMSHEGNEKPETEILHRAVVKLLRSQHVSKTRFVGHPIPYLVYFSSFVFDSDDA